MKKLILGFSAIIILILSLGLYSLSSMSTLSQETSNLYEHPFKVSNAVKQINIHLISMHRYMKDIVLAENSTQRNLAITQVNQHEEKALSQFAVVFQKYLGDPKEVHHLYRLFISWEAIRNEVIALSINHQGKEAAKITKNKGAQHVQKLNHSIHKLLAFAQNKADDFYTRSQTNSAISHAILTTVLILVLLLSAMIAFIVISGHKKAEKKIKQQLHLIDQNIMIATLNIQGEVQAITHEFARYIKQNRQTLLGKNVHFFLGKSCQKSDEILQTLMSGKTWEGEIEREVKGLDTQHFQAHIIPNYNEKFELISFTHIIHDISDKKALEVLSITDKLTNLYNRRHFDVTLSKEVSIAKRLNTQIALVILDIDYFKKYNDCYGHPAGDKVLSQVAETLLSFMKRPNDYLFRLGGEEFGILFNSTDKKNSIQFLNEIKKAIQALHIAHSQSDVSDVVTISIGAKFIHGDEVTNVDELYQQADEALYRAKEKRNSLVVVKSNMVNALETETLEAVS